MDYVYSAFFRKFLDVDCLWLLYAFVVWKRALFPVLTIPSDLEVNEFSFLGKLLC